MIVFFLREGSYEASARVLATGTENWVEVDGTFAGWIKVGQ
jgi:hypothetical protein